MCASNSNRDPDRPPKLQADPPGANSPTTEAIDNDTDRRWRLAAALAAALVVLAYANSLAGQFIFDDRSGIRDNHAIRRLWPIWNVLTARPMSRPIVNLSLAINYAVSGLETWSYHVLNVAVHAAAALALFGLVRRVMTSPRLGPRCAGVSTAIAFLVAALWAVHPLQTAAVTYMIQRAESMMGMFYLLCLYCAVRGFASPRPARWYALSVAASVLGMGCKQVMVSAPLMAMLFDRTFFAGSFRSAWRLRRKFYVALAATWLVLATSVPTILHGQTAGLEVETYSPLTYALTQFGVIMHYIRLAFWPDPLVLDYVWTPATTLSETLPHSAVVLVLVALTGWALWRNNPAGVAGAWFFLILAPTSSVLPIRDPIFEHRMYLPLAAILTLTIAGAYTWYAAWKPGGPGLVRYARRFVGAAAMPAVLLAIAAGVWATHRRNLAYATPITIWQDVLSKQPQNARAYNNLGVALVEQGRIDQAMQCYRKALLIQPGYAGVHRNVGSVLARLGRYDEALVHYRRAVEIRPDNHEFHCSLGKLLAKLGRTDEALKCFGRALQLAPKYPLGNYEKAMLLDAQGHPDQALPYFQTALRAQPWQAAWHYNYANALRKTGRIDEAVEQYRRTVRLEPDNAPAHNNLGLLLARQGRFAEAVAHYRAALAAKGDYHTAMSNLAWLLATCRDESIRNGQEALTLAQRLCRQSGYKQIGYLDALAAAYAETGQFDKAVEIIERIIELLGPNADDPLKRKFRDRLKLYRSARPLRGGR